MKVSAESTAWIRARAILARSTIIAAVLNILVKILSIFSEKEHHHSYTDFEKSVTQNCHRHADHGSALCCEYTRHLITRVFVQRRTQYFSRGDSEFATKLQQVAFINAFSLPFSMASKVIVGAKPLLVGTVSIERQLDELAKPSVPHVRAAWHARFRCRATLLFSYGHALLSRSPRHAHRDRQGRVVASLREAAEVHRASSPRRSFTVLVGIIVHLLVAVYMYGERDLPSYTTWAATGKGAPRHDVRSQGDRPPVRRRERIARSTDSSRSWGSSCGTSFVIAYAALFWRRRRQKGEGDDSIDEDLPPSLRLKRLKQLTARRRTRSRRTRSIRRCSPRGTWYKGLCAR